MGHNHVDARRRRSPTRTAPRRRATTSTTRAPSGPIPARVYGPSDQVIPQGWIHNLEHGGLVILYKGDSAGRHARGPGRASSRTSTADSRRPANCGPVIARFDQMSSPFQAIVWGRVLPLETFDQAQIRPSGTSGAAGRTPSSSARHRTAARTRAPRTPGEHTPTVADGRPRRRATRRRRPPRRAPKPRRRRADPARCASSRISGTRTAARPSSSATALIPVMDGYLTGPDLEPESLDDLRRRAADARPAPPASPLDDVELVAPIPIPGKVVCVGLNYREHVSEGGRPRPTRPLLFSKFANAVIADGEPIVRPEGTHALDLEVELGVVIGTTRPARHRAPTRSTTSRATSSSTTSAPATGRASRPRSREGEGGDGQWLRAKGSDTFLPMGPVFVDRRRDPGPAADSGCARGGSRLRPGRRPRASRCRTARPPT